MGIRNFLIWLNFVTQSSPLTTCGFVFEEQNAMKNYVFQMKYFGVSFIVLTIFLTCNSHVIVMKCINKTI